MDALSNQSWFFSDDDSKNDSEPETHAVTAALLAFDACRSQAAQTTGYTWRPRRVPEHVVAQREPLMRNEITQIYDALPETEQLRVYRFFLTAVHRNSVLAHRFDPIVLSSPERSAALEAEFDRISHELDEMIEEVMAHSLLPDPKGARLHSADFLWSLSWWVHARRDVTAYRFSPDEDILVLSMLGRAPDPIDKVPAQLYVQAAIAELDYRTYAMSDSAPKVRKRGFSLGARHAVGLSKRLHQNGDDWHM